MIAMRASRVSFGAMHGSPALGAVALIGCYRTGGGSRAEWSAASGTRESSAR